MMMQAEVQRVRLLSTLAWGSDGTLRVWGTLWGQMKITGAEQSFAMSFKYQKIS
jgi:hypothetical protein